MSFYLFKLTDNKGFPEFNCLKLTTILESYTPSGLKCITLFSDLIANKYIFYKINSIKYDTIIDSAFIH